MANVGIGKRMRRARSVTMFEVVVLEGQGVPGSTAREVTYLYRLNGELVAKHDPHPEPAFSQETA